MSIGSARRNTARNGGPNGSIPGRDRGDAFRVSDDQMQRARLVVAKNSEDSEDLRELLDMLGLISSNPDQPPPVTR